MDQPIKICSLNNHSLYLCSENNQLGKSVIITTNLNKSKVKEYKEELLYIIPMMTVENLLNQYRLFNQFVDQHLSQRDMQLNRRKDGIHVALICSYFLKQSNLSDAMSVNLSLLKIIQALEIGVLEEKYMESLKAFEMSLKPKFKIKIEEVKSWISHDPQPDNEIIQSVALSQAVFKSRLVEQQKFSRILNIEDFAESVLLSQQQRMVESTLQNE